MAWCHAIEDVPDQDAMARAKAVKRYAQMVVRLAKEGKYDPQKTALARAMGMHTSKALDGLADDDSGVFSPRQLAYLRRMAETLRAYARGQSIRHTHPEGCMGVPTKRPTRLTTVPIDGWEPDSEADEELGILPAIPALIGAAAPLIGSLLGGGGGSKKTSPSPVAASANAGMSLPAIGGVVADQIRAVPPPVRQQVTDAVREIMDQQKAGQMDVAAMMKQISELLGPKLKSQLDSVNQAALQRQATYEHESLKRRDERWKQNHAAQQAILDRITAMEKRIGSVMVADKRRNKAVARAWGVPPTYQ